MKAERCHLHLALAAWATTLVEGFIEADVVALQHWHPGVRLEPDATCRENPLKPCKLSEMQRDKTYLVYPGGKTICLNPDEPEYSFTVIPGDADKLLFYFEGGGICFDEMSRTVWLCPDKLGDTKVDGQPIGHGIFNRDSERNPFKNYTVVIAKYCSGDLYLGNLKKDYGEVRGVTNARAVVDWAKKQANPWDKLVLSGQSAGGIAIHIWSRIVLQEFKYNHGAVIIDSFVVGIFPGAAQRMLTEHFDLCASNLLSRDDEADCKAGKFTVQQALTTAMDEFPDVAFAHVNSKTDAGQLWMYNVVASILFQEPILLTPEDYYRQILSQMEIYNTRPNFVSYLVNADVHGYFNKEIVVTSQTSGLYGLGWPGEISLHEWLSQFPITSGKTVKSQCFGRRYYPERWLELGPTADYCDEYQSRKVYGQVEIDKATAKALSKEDFSDLRRRPVEESKHKWRKIAPHIHEDKPPVDNILSRSEPNELSHAAAPQFRVASRLREHMLPMVLVAGVILCSLGFYFGRSYFQRHRTSTLQLQRARSTESLDSELESAGE